VKDTVAVSGILFKDHDVALPSMQFQYNITITHVRDVSGMIRTGLGACMSIYEANGELGVGHITVK